MFLFPKVCYEMILNVIITYIGQLRIFKQLQAGYLYSWGVCFNMTHQRSIVFYLHPLSTAYMNTN